MPAREEDDLLFLTIPELTSAEERLAHQALLSHLQPTDARRLAAVKAELDRRWSAGYLTRPHGERELGADLGEYFSWNGDRNIQVKDADWTAVQIEHCRGPGGSPNQKGVH